jgi:signal peptidase I
MDDSDASKVDADTVDDGAGVAPVQTAKPKQASFVRELPVLIGLALLLAILIKIFLVQAFFIPSGSMEETLQVGDRVLVNKLVYRFRDIGRGEVVVFNGLDSFVQDADMRVAAPSNALERVFFKVGGLIGVPQPGEKDFIKRVIGLPGDVVACCTDGHVTVNGVPLDESSYVFEDNAEPFSETVPEGKLWVMGDHRGYSSDSRRNGAVPLNRVIGRAFVVVWPVSRAGGLPVPSTFEDQPTAADTALAVATSPLAMSVALVAPVAVRRHRRRAASDRRAAGAAA